MVLTLVNMRYLSHTTLDFAKTFGTERSSASNHCALAHTVALRRVERGKGEETTRRQQGDKKETRRRQEGDRKEEGRRNCEEEEGGKERRKWWRAATA